MLGFIEYKLFYTYPFGSWLKKYLTYKANVYSKKNSLYEKTCQEISEYTHEPLEVVIYKYKTGSEFKNEVAIFINQQSLDKESVDEFYTRYSYYIYELPLWNAERARPYYLWLIIRPFIRINSYKTFLDYGAGAGDFCIEIANHNLSIDYFDINELLINFVRARFKKRGVQIRIYNDISSINKEYDCICSFDVFEHLKDLPSHLDIISKKLIKGSGLIFSGAFSGGTLHLQENEKYNNFKVLDSLLSSKGLKFCNRFAQFYFYKKL